MLQTLWFLSRYPFQDKKSIRSPTFFKLASVFQRVNMLTQIIHGARASPAWANFQVMKAGVLI
jgi:hypothetical protein